MRERIANAIWDFIMGYPAKEEKLQAIASLDLTALPKAVRVNFEGGDMGKGGLPVDPSDPNLGRGEIPYSINGRRRPERWSKRKKELEAASRQKRRRLESFRETE